MQSPLFYFVENVHALFHAVNSDIRILRVFIHRLDDTSCSREHSRPAAFSDILASAEFYAFFPEPSVELVEHQDRIHRIFFCRLCLFGNARPYENGLRFRMSAFYISAVRLHRRDHRRKREQCLRVIFSQHQIYAGTARRHQDIRLFLIQYPLIFFFHYGRSYRSLFRSRKSQLFQRVFQRIYADSGVAGCKRRSDARVNGARLQHDPDFFHIACDDFRILRTDGKTAPAQYAFVFHDMRLSRCESYGLYSAVSDAFVTALAVCLFQSEYFSHMNSSSSRLLTYLISSLKIMLSDVHLNYNRKNPPFPLLYKKRTLPSQCPFYPISNNHFPAWNYGDPADPEA